MASVNPRDRIGEGKARLAGPALVALSFILIFGAACVIGFNSYREATRHTIVSNETRANLLAKVILEHQRAAIGLLRSYASRPTMIEAVKKKNFEETVKDLTTLVKNNPETERAFVADPAGIVRVRFPIDKKAPLNVDMSHRDWYKGVSKGWTVYVSSVFKQIIGEKNLAIAISVPVFDRDRKVIGILAASQTTGFFNRLISEIGLNADSKITLVDQKGQVIYSNKFPYTKEVIVFPCIRSVEEAKARGRGNVEIRDPSDRDRVKYVSFENIEGIGWSVFAEKDSGEVLRSEWIFHPNWNHIDPPLHGCCPLPGIFQAKA